MQRKTYLRNTFNLVTSLLKSLVVVINSLLAVLYISMVSLIFICLITLLAAFVFAIKMYGILDMSFMRSMETISMAEQDVTRIKQQDCIT